MKKLFILACLLPSLLGGQLFSLDRLAADEEAARYRTGIIDSRVQQVPSEISEELVTNPEKYLADLVGFLIKGEENDFVKVKRLHDWITEHIGYDNDLFYDGTGGGSRNTYELLKLGRTTCGGFSSLFKKMADLAGIKAVVISGKSRETFYISQNRMAGHVWNAVFIQNRWYIVDTTHDSRFSFNQGRFKKKSPYKDTCLFVSARAKGIRNLPDDPAYQFLEKPVSEEEFLTFPLVNMNYIKYGVHFLTDMKSVITKEKVPDRGENYLKIVDKAYIDDTILKIELNCPPDVALYAKMVDTKGKYYTERAFSYREGDKVICLFSAPGTGTFSAYISGRFLSPRDKYAQKLYTFEIVSRSGSGPVLPAADYVYTFEGLELYGVTILDHNLSGQSGGEYFLEVSYPADKTVVFSGIYDENDKRIKSGTTVRTLESAGNKVRLRYAYTFDKKGSYIIKLRVKNKGEKYYNETAAMVKKVIK